MLALRRRTDAPEQAAARCRSWSPAGGDNEGVETLARLPDGALLAIVEGGWRRRRACRRAGGRGRRRPAALSRRRSASGRPTPTSAATWLFVLERRLSLLGGWQARIVAVPAGRPADGAAARSPGRELATIAGRGSARTTRRWRPRASRTAIGCSLVSDDNFNGLQRTLLLALRWPAAGRWPRRRAPVILCASLAGAGGAIYVERGPASCRASRERDDARAAAFACSVALVLTGGAGAGGVAGSQPGSASTPTSRRCSAATSAGLSAAARSVRRSSRLRPPQPAAAADLLRRLRALLPAASRTSNGYSRLATPARLGRRSAGRDPVSRPVRALALGRGLRSADQHLLPQRLGRPERDPRRVRQPCRRPRGRSARSPRHRAASSCPSAA